MKYSEQLQGTHFCVQVKEILAVPTQVKLGAGTIKMGQLFRVMIKDLLSTLAEMIMEQCTYTPGIAVYH